ncbi:hypothetical protein KIW84_064025 [Lathyrus oleraceus]|uniref:Ubiquitin-like protease family profile domain-containing protein n=1 Tax=Pisum sativum TaxID=3888 RepID=A0A9D4WD81_PEA|nr:hypothetical protein KIW84_064025 [Pisum sativum]
MASDQENSQDANAPDDTSEKEITRGITIMKSIIRDRDKAVTYNVNWNADNQLIGSNAAKLASYIGTLVRMHIPITATRWSNKELGSAKDKIWTEILRSFNIEDTTIRKKYILQLAGKRHRGWRTFLTNKYLKDKEIFFVEYDPEYPVKYAIFITDEEWVAFVAQRRDENFKKVSATNRERASNPTYAYKKGRLGYARLEEKILDETKSDATSLPPHVLWKEARVGKDGTVRDDVQHIYDECETLSQSISTAEDQENRSVLSRALNVPEYPGRVRGKGHGCTPTSLYKNPRRRNPSNQEVMETLQALQAQVLQLQKDNERYRCMEKCSSQLKETSEKASINCQNKFPEGISSCQLYLSSPTYRLVGKGKVHNTSGDLLHHRPLPDGHLKVSVDVVLDKNALLPIPDIVSETTLLRDAIGSFVAWPLDLIYIDDETPTKPASKDEGILRHNESVASQKEVFAQGSQQLSQKIGSRQKNKRDLPVTSLPKKGAFVPRYQIPLETLVDSSDMATAGAIRLLDMEEDIFGYSCTETIGKEDLEHIFRHQELGVGVIHTYIRFLYDNFMRGNDQLSNRFRFVSSSLVNKALICREPDSCREYLVKRFMASSTNNLYLWPYNSGCHWLLLAIDPLKEVVYFLNSIDGEWTNYPDMKQLVDTSIKVFRSQRQARVPRTKSSNITWIKVQCPLQRNGIDCGYFVMRFMREIINMNQIEIPITYFDEYKCAHYTRLQLEQIKEELCQYFIEKRLISI